MMTPGTIVDGRFEVVALLGEGGMGTVYQAMQAEMHRTVALKLLKSELASEPEKVARFRNEARVISALKHPHIVQVYSVGVAGSGQPYMAMELVEGESLSSIVTRRGSLTYEEALPLFIQICEGLQYAHEQQIIHRDIKPSNVIICSENGKQIAKIVDFGIAKVLSDAGQNLTRTGMAMGSVFYLSPGQMEGRKPDPASDIYALGCSLFEVLAGAPPFQSDSALLTMHMHHSEAPPAVLAMNPSANIPPTLQEVISCMLAKDAGERYASASEVAADLQAVLNGHDIKFARKQTASRTPVKSLKSAPKRLFIPIVATIALLAIYGIVTAYNMYSLQPYERPATEQVVSDLDAARRAQSVHEYDRALEAIDKARKKAATVANPIYTARVETAAGTISNDAWQSSERKDDQMYAKTLESMLLGIKSANKTLAENWNSDDQTLAKNLRAGALHVFIQAKLDKGEPVSDNELNVSLEYMKDTRWPNPDTALGYVQTLRDAAIQRTGSKESTSPDAALQAIAVFAQANKEIIKRPASEAKQYADEFATVLDQRFGRASRSSARVREIFADAYAN